MKKLGLLLVFALFLSLIPVYALETDSYETTTPGIIEDLDKFTVNRVEYYKGASGYDRLLKPDGTVFVYSQRYHIEYLQGKNWKQIGIPYQVKIENNTVIRDYTDYIDTTYSIIYDIETGKTNVSLNSGQSREYRIIWEMAGITNNNYIIGDGFINFTGPVDWVCADWNDALGQFGDIVTPVIESHAEGRKLTVSFNIGVVPQGESLVLDPTLIDSYTSGEDGSDKIQDNHPSDGGGESALSQSFDSLGVGTILVTASKVKLRNIGNPTGNLTANIYGHSGTYGTSSVPTGSALATSDPVLGSSIGGVAEWVWFNFSTPYVINSSVKYCYVIQASAGGTWDASHYVRMSLDGSSPEHDGNSAEFAAGSWSVDNTEDYLFYIYGEEVSDPIITGRTTENVTRNDYSWLNVTAYSEAGYSYLENMTVTVIDPDDTYFTFKYDFGTTTFSETADSEKVATLNAGTSTLTEVNSSTANVCFYYTVTDGADGWRDLNVTLYDESGNNDTEAYTDEIYYVYYGWDALENLLNSISDYLAGTPLNFFSEIKDYTDGVLDYFTTAIIDVITLLDTVYTVINGTFTWFIRWATRLVNLLVSVFTIVVALLNGTHDLTSSLGSLWDIVNFSEWYDFVPILMLVAWMSSLDKRTKTQGFGYALWSDISAMIGIASFFFTWFSFVIDTALQMIFWFLDRV